MKVYLVRHAESRGNSDRVIITDPPLTETGRNQAIRLYDILPKDYDMVYTSDLERTKMTVLLSLNLKEDDPKLQIEPGLREIEVPEDMNGTPFHEIQVSNDDFLKWVYLEDDIIHTKYNTEPILEFVKRTSEAFLKIVQLSEKNSHKKVIIVSHGGTMRAILTKHLGLINPRDLFLENTEIVVIKNQNGKWEFSERITSHIE